MLTNQHRIIKEDIKKYARYSLYKKQTNVLISGDKQGNGKRYLIELNFLADQNNSLIEVFLFFFDSIFEAESLHSNQTIQPPITYNKIFIFFIRLYFLHDKFLSKTTKLTEQEVIAELDIIGRYKSSHLQFQNHKTNLQVLIREASIYINKKIKEKFKQRQRTEQMHQEAFSYEIVQIVCREQKAKTIQQIIKISNRSVKRIYLPEEMESIQQLYLQSLLNTLTSIRFTKKAYRSTKYSHFIEKMYKNYYKTEWLEIKNMSNRSDIPKKFLMQRYTNNDKQYLIDTFSFIRMREKNVQYEPESLQMSKQLLKQILLHKSATKSCYPLLNPKLALFNQLSLKVHLSYENPLLWSVGLLSRPANIENMICFQASPRPFDTFATTEELTNPDLLANHLIGINKLNKESLHNDKKDNQKRSDHNLLQIQQRVGNKSQTWRFMLTVHYFMKGQEYFKSQSGKKIENLEGFKKFVKQQQTKLQDNSSYYLNIIGDKFASSIPVKPGLCNFDLNIYFFEGILNEKDSEEILMKEFGSIKIDRYLKTYCFIYKELVSIIESQTVAKIYNILIYLLRFYLGLLKEFFLMSIVCQYLKKNTEIAWHILADNRIKGLISAKQQSISYFSALLSKLGQYKERFERKKQMQIRYTLENYKQQFDRIELYYDLIGKFHENMNKIFFELPRSQPNINEPGKNWTKQSPIKDFSEGIQQNLMNLIKIVATIVRKEFFSNKKDDESIELKYKKNRLKLFFIAACSLNPENFVIIQSIVLPALQPNPKCNKKSRNQQKNNLDYSQQNELYQYSLQILKGSSVQMLLIEQNSSDKKWDNKSAKQHRQKD